MNIQDERIQSACERLTLKAVADQYAVLAQEAVQDDHSFSDYLEQCLKAELDARRLRSQAMLVRIAGFPAIKLLDDFDFRFARGAPKKAIQNLASLAFIERKENIILLGPSGVGKTHLAIALGYLAVDLHPIFPSFCMQEVNHPSVAQSNTVKQFDCCSRGKSECKFTLFLVQISVQINRLSLRSVISSIMRWRNGLMDWLEWVMGLSPVLWVACLATTTSTQDGPRPLIYRQHQTLAPLPRERFSPLAELRTNRP